jgi:hypothetical protein
MKPLGRSDEGLGEPTGGGATHDQKRVAQVLTTATAVVARAIDQIGLKQDAITDRDTLDIRANRVHIASDLVSRDHREIDKRMVPSERV